jgi:hypothetical protein
MVAAIWLAKAESLNEESWRRFESAFSCRAPGFAVKGEQRSMNPNKALWEKGDFTRIAASMRESERLSLPHSASPRE